MAITPAQLEQQIRSQTDRINDPSITSDEILAFMNDAGRALVDLFNETAPHWLQSHDEFTLTGNTFDTSVVALPDDFELDLGLDWLNAPGSIGPVTIRRLPTFQDRNAFSNVNPLIPGNNYWNRNYEAQGDELRIYAPNNLTAGDYRLWYVKRWQELASPVTVPIEVETSDQAQDDSPNLMRFAFANGDFTAADVGGTLTVDFDSPNEAYNGTFIITSVLSSTVAYVDVAWPGGTFTLPATGTASKSVQPEGTTPTLPNVWVQFKLFLLTHAAISVRMKFEEQIGELETRLGQESNRCLRMAEKRDSGLAQIPILGGRGSVDTPLFDGGGNDDGWY